MEWRVVWALWPGRTQRAGHRCKPVGHGRAMFHLILTTSAGTFRCWDEVGRKLIGIEAEELMSRTHGLCLREDLLQAITTSNWRLTVENTANCHGQLYP